MSTPQVRVRISGPLACFTRPEAKVERVSYECMTPSAARNILDCICWRPEMRWVVTSISVLKPVRFLSIRRNELQSRLAPKTVAGWMKDPSTFEPQMAGAGTDTDGTPRNTLALRDVAYLVEAFPLVFHPTADDTPTKYMAMFNRRVEKGQCFHRPALGCREFAADFELPGPADTPILDSLEIGNMLYDIVFRGSGNQAVFFQAAIRRGVLDTDPERVIPDPALRQEVLSCSYKR